MTEADAGETVVAGETFPERVFRGVGFLFSGLSEGDSFTLWNPVITNAGLREECENRTAPVFYEPLGRVESSSPENECVITEEDQERFDNQEVGTCACDLPFAGGACDCPALVDSKFGKKVCGGVGDEGKAVQPPDGGAITTTGTGTEAGCYIYGTSV